MPINAPNTRNRPIATLIKWYAQRTKGKVVESRQEIQRRFDGLDWKDQKKIILAFLSSGKADRKWVYTKLIKNWDDDFLPIVLDLFEKYHEEGCLLPVTLFFPTDYVKDHFDELSEGKNYYKLCYRLANDQVEFEPRREKLSPKEYLYILKLQEKKPDDDVVLSILYEVLYDLCTNKYTNYNGITLLSSLEKDRPIVASDFVYVNALVERLKTMGCDSALEKFMRWEEFLRFTLSNSREFKEIDRNDDFGYNHKRWIVAKNYIRLLLNDKFEKKLDSKIRSIYEERFEKMKSENEFLGMLEDKFGLEISE